MRLFLGVSAAGCASPLISDIPDFVSPWFATIIVTIVIVDAIGNYSAKAEKFGRAANHFERLAQGNRYLWTTVQNQNDRDEDILDQLVSLQARANEIANNIDEPVNAKVNKRAQRDAFAEEQQRHAIAEHAT